MKSYLIIISLLITVPISMMIINRIKMMYRRYCKTEDMKDVIEFNNMKIKGAVKFIQSKYNDNLNRAIIFNIIPKINFCQNLIRQRSIEDQVILTNKLFDLIYETNQRLLEYIDVNAILNPLNNFYRELSSHKLKEVVETIDNH